jgi:lysophospholipase L1-like esterase
MKKHIICIGDSNTHGLCADPTDSADGGNRFNEEERWPCLLQAQLGPDYLVIEEGQSGRTTVFDDPCYESRAELPLIYSQLMSHEPIDLMILMLGTNDSKEWLGVTPPAMGWGMERLLQKAMSVDCWRNRKPNILLVAPAPIQEGYKSTYVGQGTSCPEKTAMLSGIYAEIAERYGFAFLDADGCAINQIDYVHLTRLGHKQLAERISAIVPTLLD